MFGLSKVLEFFLEPGNALVLPLAIGAALQWSRWQRTGRLLTAMSTSLFVALLVFPIGYWLVQPLEDQYSRPSSWPARVGTILVLGGALDPAISLTRSAASEDDVEGRFATAAELARHYPRARIVFSGGSGALLGGEAPESQVARQAFAQLGIDARRISYEGESRNTWENLLYSQRLFRPKPEDVWVLATSASQLPRAMEVARRLKWKLVPWPSDYRTPAFHGGFISNLDLVSNLELLDIGLHEWAGIFAYRLTGRGTPG